MGNDSNNRGAEFGSDKDGDKKRRRSVNNDRTYDHQNHLEDTVPFCDEHVISKLKIGESSSEDNVWLDAAIEWRPKGSIPLKKMSLFAAISKQVSALIQIWRRNRLGNTLVTEKTDISPAIVTLTVDGGFISFNHVNTVIRVMDKPSTDEESEYVVTFRTNPELPAGIHLDQSNVSAYQFFATISENK